MLTVATVISIHANKSTAECTSPRYRKRVQTLTTTTTCCKSKLRMKRMSMPTTTTQWRHQAVGRRDFYQSEAIEIQSNKQRHVVNDLQNTTVELSPHSSASTFLYIRLIESQRSPWFARARSPSVYTAAHITSTAAMLRASSARLQLISSRRVC